MTNPLVQLRRLLPPSPVLIGTVLAHHAEDDTSTIELPVRAETSTIAAGVAVGARIRARGRTVPVGQRAFVRDGVVETQAPSGDVIDIEVGRITTPLPRLEFSGPIPDYTFTVGDTVLIDLAAFFSSAFRPIVFALAGTLPLGLSFNPATGVLSGVPIEEAAAPALQVVAQDAEGTVAASNAFGITVSEVIVPTGPNTEGAYFYDSFSGPAAPLAGRAPDIAPSGITWNDPIGNWSTDGAGLLSNATTSNAYTQEWIGGPALSMPYVTRFEVRFQLPEFGWFKFNMFGWDAGYELEVLVRSKSLVDPFRDEIYAYIYSPSAGDSWELSPAPAGLVNVGWNVLRGAVVGADFVLYLNDVEIGAQPVGPLLMAGESEIYIRRLLSAPNVETVGSTLVDYILVAGPPTP